MSIPILQYQDSEAKRNEAIATPGDAARSLHLIMLAMTAYVYAHSGCFL
ncbi:hypothetical protein [Nostoc sp. UHCC 0252]|nr:hypothetical protein [Nostoc sp. UHCC 0252]MEA5603780.1 hypothetical protein [Nostoc sp. UHCC 0252]